MKKVKVAQIGISNTGHGIQVWGSLVKQADVFDVVGYVLPENERELCPKRVTCFEGYPELTLEQVLSDPEIEAVVVETEERYLVKYALMARFALSSASPAQARPLFSTSSAAWTVLPRAG